MKDDDAVASVFSKLRIRLAAQRDKRELVEWASDVSETDCVFETGAIDIAIDPETLRSLASR
jgi:hypothetical protein